ncbi:MAG: hypothetical protein GPJ51_11095 [Candidatus Heimdallarchaeota archaeon]|nr:hypothetical protein [Candidatus Heimdallarchaeota archaeon]
MSKDALKERIRNEMVKKPSYKESLQELLVDPEEFELLEIRETLEKINEDKTVVDEDGYIKLLDISQGIMLLCENCNSWQPFSIREGWRDEIWFRCEGCNLPNDFVMRRNF